MANAETELVEFLLREFEALIEEIPDEWIQSSIEGNFGDYEMTAEVVRPTLLESVDLPVRLHQVSTLFMDYGEGRDRVELWTAMSAKRLKPTLLMVFLWFPLERALKPDSTIAEQKTGIVAGRAYLAMCGITGSQAYGVFNQFLYQKVLDVFRLVLRMLSACTQAQIRPAARTTAGRKPSSKSRGTGTSGKSTSRGRNTTQSTRMDRQDGSRSRRSFACRASFPDEMQALSSTDETELKELLGEALDAVFLCLGKVALSTFPEIAISTANFVRDLAQLDIAQCSHVIETARLSDFAVLTRFATRSFALAHRLIDPRHNGAQLVLARMIMPRLLYWTFENAVLPSQAAIPVAFNHNKDLALRFLEQRIAKGSEEEIATVYLMLQNVCHRCSDRVEYRVRVARVVCDVLALLPRQFTHRFVKFICLFGRNQKIAMRLFAVDVAMQLLVEYDFTRDAETEAMQVVKEENDEDEGESQRGEGEETSERASEARSDDEGECDEQMEEEAPKTKKPSKSVATQKPQPLDDRETLLTLLLDACNDRAPTARTRALTHLVPVMKKSELRDRIEAVSARMEKDARQLQSPDVANGDVRGDNGNVSLRGEELREDAEMRARITDNPVLNMILERCGDEKVFVRKAAIYALQVAYTTLTHDAYKHLVVDTLKMRARDVAMSVRKQVAESLTALVTGDASADACDSRVIEQAWITTVLAMVIDRDVAVQQLASRLVMDVIASPIMNDGRDANSAWRFMATIEKEADHRRLLLRALIAQSAEGALTDRIVAVLQRKVDEPEKAVMAWMLMADLSTVFKVNPNKARVIWYTIADEASTSRIVSYVAKVIASGVAYIRDVDRADLAEDFSRRLYDLHIDVANISTVYYALAQLFNAVGEEATGMTRLSDWNRRFFDRWQPQLHNLLYEVKSTSSQDPHRNQIATEDSLIRVVSLMGEMLQYTPALIDNEIFKILQILIASDVIQSQFTQLHDIMSRPPTAVTPVGDASASARSHAVTGDGELDAVVTGAISGTQPWSQTGSQMPVVCTPLLTRAVRAHAVIALGKLCLQDETLAKKCVPVFAKQLKCNDDHYIRNNIVVVICDLCTRYTLLVDRYSAILAACLKDRSNLVRQQTLMLLTNLIKEQFLKWEGQIMYRFVSTVFDECAKIRSFAEFCLLDILLVQFPDMFFNHFLECVFYFNGVVHASWTVARQARGEDAISAEEMSTQCALSGDAHSAERLRLYKFMIRTMGDQKKFVIAARISNEIYGAIVEGSLDFANANVISLLLDAFKIMTADEMKLTNAVGQRDPVLDEDEQPEAPAAVQEHAKEIITNIFRQAIIDEIIPNVISLKCFLQRKRSPFLRECMELIRELCKDHRQHLDVFLASDRQLKAEIEFDLRRLEEKERREMSRRQREAEAARQGGERVVEATQEREENDDENPRNKSRRETGDEQQQRQVEDDGNSEEEEGERRSTASSHSRSGTPEHPSTPVALDAARRKREIGAARGDETPETALPARSTRLLRRPPSSTASSTTKNKENVSDKMARSGKLLQKRTKKSKELDARKKGEREVVTTRPEGNTVASPRIRKMNVRLTRSVTPAVNQVSVNDVTEKSLQDAEKGVRNGEGARNETTDLSQLAARAISTPQNSQHISEVTFRDMNLSAIPRKTPLRASTRISNRRQQSDMQPIVDEDEEPHQSP